MQKIVPYLWFDHEAGEAAALYTSLFPNSRIRGRTKLGGTPSGEVEMLTIELEGLEFQLISAGPYFRFTPAVSFLVACQSKEEVDRLWQSLHAPGKELMPLGDYPFSQRYGWTEDKYGLSWQIMYMGDRKMGQRITPTLMFVGEACGKAEEAVRLYASLFEGSAVTSIETYGPGAEPNARDMVKHASFVLEGQEFAAMDSALDHPFTFNEAVSLMVYCDTQAEIDHFWGALSARPEAEQCGWLKDRFGLSWQIVPRAMERIMSEKDPSKLARVTEAFLKMKKFDLAELERAAGHVKA